MIYCKNNNGWNDNGVRGQERLIFSEKKITRGVYEF